MDEFEVIRRYFSPQSQSKRVIVGVGDDGAVVRPDENKDLVCVVDTLVESVHFPSQLSPEDIGFRAVAVNVSDIAAMGAQPKWMTLALTLSDADPNWLQGFAAGLFAASEHFGVELIGGDTTRGTAVVISVQIIGEVSPGQAITRAGAQPGNEIFVSGSPGDAAFGLSIVESGITQDSQHERLIRRFTRPDARVELGQELCRAATAAIDLSDGLYADLSKLLSASGVGGCIELDKLPASRDLIALIGRDDARRLALSGGDDYEICFTVPTGVYEPVAELGGVLISRIGKVSGGDGLTCTLNGSPVDYHDDGYRHFSVI